MFAPANACGNSPSQYRCQALFRLFGGKCSVALLALALAFSLVGCGDGQRVAELETKIAELEKTAREHSDTTELTLENLQKERDNLMARLEQAELQSRSALEQAGNVIAEQENRFGQLEESFTALARRREMLESVAYLPVGGENHATLGTAHGTFLVRIDEVAAATDGASGQVVTLNIGNPLGLTVNEFTLRGHYGAPTPSPTAGEDDEAFRQRLEAWERGITPFQHLFVKPLPPGEWTQLELPLPNATAADIRMLRFVMIVDRAFLENQTGHGEFAVVSALTEGSAIATTPYGAFLVSVNGTTIEGSNTRLKLAIGNPFILTVQKARMRGQFGPVPPKRQPDETLPVFASRLQDWQSELTSFDDLIETPILPGRWSDASIVVPTKVVNDLGYIRFTFSPEAAYLPVPEGASGPR